MIPITRVTKQEWIYIAVMVVAVFGILWFVVA